MPPKKQRSISKASALKNIDAVFSAKIAKLAKMIAKGNRNEDETRRWIIDILINAFGYHEDMIETEAKAIGQKVDIVIKKGTTILLVIECKASNVKITQPAINQAVNYATSLGTEWALLTNGQSWRLYHVTPVAGENPEICEVFSVDVFDDDGVSKDDINMLYLLTEKAITSGQTLTEYHISNFYSTDNLAISMLEKPVLTAIKKSMLKNYKKYYNVEFDETSIDSEYIKDIVSIMIGVEDQM